MQLLPTVSTGRKRGSFDLLDIGGIMLLERLQHTYLDLAGISILLDGPDDLDGHFPPCLDMSCFHDLAKCPLAK